MPRINYGTINVVALDTWTGMTGVCVGVVVQLCSFRSTAEQPCIFNAFYTSDDEISTSNHALLVVSSKPDDGLRVGRNMLFY